MAVFSVPGPAQNFLVHHYTEADGLPSPEVRGILQDRQGQMWFASRAGVAVYDGVEWIRFTAKDGLPGVPVSKIDIDSRQRIWAMTSYFSDAFIYYYTKEKWKRFSLRPPVNEKVKINDFKVLNLSDREFPYLAIATESKGLYLWDGRQWHGFNSTNGLPGNTVYGLATLNETLYAATEKGLRVIRCGPDNQFIIESEINRKMGIPDEDILGISIQFAGKYADSSVKYPRIWLAGQKWLGYFSEDIEKAITVFPMDNRLKKAKLKLLLQPDYRGGIYIGSDYKVHYFNLKTGAFRNIGVANGLVSEGTYAMAIDYEKNIWVACHRGVSKIASRRFSNYGIRHGLLEDEVTSVLQYNKDLFVLGHNEGITFFEPGNPSLKERFSKVSFNQTGIPRSSLCRVLEMVRDTGGNIWAAASDTGLVKITPDRKFTWYGSKHGLPNSIVCLWPAENGKLWIGTIKGIYLYDREKFTHQAIGRFQDPSVRRIWGHKNDLTYLASIEDGLFLYDPGAGEWKNIRAQNERGAANAVYAVHQRRSGQLLIGTGNGLYMLEKGAEAMKKFKGGGLIIHRPVYSILKDRKENIWFGTDNGLIRWDGYFPLPYTTADGLVGQEINRTAALMDTNGRLWFGTNNGLSIYDDVFDNNNFFNPTPRLRLLYTEINGEQYPLNMPLNLNSMSNTLVFHFRGISFSDEKKIRFRSKLEGFDTTWSREQYPYKQMIRYTNLSPGSYRFHLKARSSRGAWSQELTSAEIFIMKPYYKQWWFYAALFLTMVALGYAVSRFLYQKRYAALLEKKVEERGSRLNLVEKRYRHLFEESADTVFITTRSGQFVDINPAGVELFGFDSKEELLNLKSTKTLYDSLKERKAYLQMLESQGQVKDYELVFKKKSGERIITRVTASLARDRDGDIAGYRGIIRDITRQKRLEEQLMQAHKMEAIGTLAGGIAHDFNNILGVIMGYTELALDDLEEGTLLHSNIGQVMTAAERASGLVKQILAFSRQSERKRKPLKLDAILKEVMKLLRSTLPSTIDIRRNIEPDSGMVMADATQMHQVIMNLCTNSAHAMKDNGGILEVSLRRDYIDDVESSRFEDLTPGNYLRLTVSDTGHGIPMVVLKRVFEPYFTTKKAGEGTGMGLAVVHGIIKSHGGDIEVYSEPGSGTTFHVLLPRVEAGAVLLKPDTAEQTIRGTENLLMVDDEPSLIQAGTQMMARLGYSIAGFTDPLQALEAVKADPLRFDLVITDLTMPHMTGLQLAREIKNIVPGMPIILSSGFSTLATRGKIKAYGINDFVMKPIVRNELALVVRKHLDKKAAT